jgi:hypothetical protein
VKERQRQRKSKGLLFLCVRELIDKDLSLHGPKLESARKVQVLVHHPFLLLASGSGATNSRTLCRQHKVNGERKNMRQNKEQLGCSERPLTKQASRDGCCEKISPSSHKARRYQSMGCRAHSASPQYTLFGLCEA